MATCQFVASKRVFSPINKIVSSGLQPERIVIAIYGQRRSRGLVTGASSGFGWETALLLAKSGFKVKALARRLGLLEELAAQQPGIEPLSLDLTDTRQLEGFGREINRWP